MIDTYMDRADAATGYRAPPTQPRDYDSPLYFDGNWYATTIDANVARAKDTLRFHLIVDVSHHQTEMQYGIPCGTPNSYFDKQGWRK